MWKQFARIMTVHKYLALSCVCLFMFLRLQIEMIWLVWFVQPLQKTSGIWSWTLFNLHLDLLTVWYCYLYHGSCINLFYCLSYGLIQTSMNLNGGIYYLQISLIAFEIGPAHDFWKILILISVFRQVSSYLVIVIQHLWIIIWSRIKNLRLSGLSEITGTKIFTLYLGQ